MACLKKKKKLAALGLSYGMQDLSCGVWDLVPRPGIEPWAPALGARSSSHWTTREVPHGVSSYSFDGVFRQRGLSFNLSPIYQYFLLYLVFLVL